MTTTTASLVVLTISDLVNYTRVINGRCSAGMCYLPPTLLSGVVLVVTAARISPTPMTACGNQ